MLILESLCFELLKSTSKVVQACNSDVGSLFVLFAKVGESWKGFGSPAKILGRSVKVFEPYVVIFLNWTTYDLSGKNCNVCHFFVFRIMRLEYWITIKPPISLTCRRICRVHIHCV